MPEETDHNDQSKPQTPTGRNYAAGMTGGIGYVVDQSGTFPQNCNRGSVDLERLEAGGEADALRQLIEQHRNSTGSQTANDWLENYPTSLDVTTKIMPKDYKRALGDD